MNEETLLAVFVAFGVACCGIASFFVLCGSGVC